ncbi:MAG TPA: hypothetical protein VF458_10825 [Ktedonobacteraceae bacterium]
MTCSVGVIENGVVHIGGDTAGVSGWHLTLRKDKKVFRNGPFLIGGTSSFRMLQLLHHAFVPPAYDPAVDLEKYLATTFIDAIRQCFKDGGYAQKSSEQETGGVFLVGFEKRLFVIDSDYQVGETLDGYAAVGCGADVALGVLYATPDMQAARRVELALKAAEAHNNGVRGPFYVEALSDEGGAKP